MENTVVNDYSPEKIDVITKRNILTFTEAWKEIFECSISKDKLYSEVRAGRIPHTRIGTKIIFRRDTLEAWFRAQESSNYSTKHVLKSFSSRK